MRSYCGAAAGRLKRLARPLPLLFAAVMVCLAVGVAWLTATRPAPDCRRTAVYLIAALERSHRLHGRYPARLDELVSGGLLPAVPGVPWTPGVTREGYGYEADPAGAFYTVYYSEQDWFGGAGPSKVNTYSYTSTYKKWTTEWVPPEVQALELAGRRYAADRSSGNLRSFISTLCGRFRRVRWENVAGVLVDGRPCAVGGRPGLSLKAGDAEALEYCFLIEERRSAGEVVREVSTIYRSDLSGLDPAWREVFHAK